MKIFRLASMSLAAGLLLPLVTSCSSDPFPFDMNMSSENKKTTATIQLRLSVEDTRAGEMSTAEENAVKKLIIYVFDDNHQLEYKDTIGVQDGSNEVTLEVKKV